MTTGTVLFDTRFEFHDGDVGRKLIVILSDARDGIHIAVITTSRQKRKHREAGCQSNDQPANFFVVDGTSCLDGDSWLLLNYFYELKAADLLQRSFAGEVRHIGTLSRDMSVELIACALESFDISTKQHEILSDVLGCL